MKEVQEEIVGLLPLDLQHLSKGALRILAADPGVDPSLLRHILFQEREDPETVRCLIRNPALPDEAFLDVLSELPEALREEVAARQKELAVLEDRSPAQVGSGSASRTGEKETAGRHLNVHQQIQRMSVGDKIAYALKGPKEARGVLVRDPNKEIALTVMKNPKITESEVEFYAAATNVCEEIQREIGKNREWCKKYGVVRALVFNPKTPVGVALEKLPYIKNKDLQFLSKSRNIPSVVRNTAKRMLARKKRNS